MAVGIAPGPGDLTLSPPYWIPFLIALGMVLTFLAYIFLKIFTVLMEPIRHTLDQVNDSLIKQADSNVELSKQLAVMIDRDSREARH